MQGGQEQDWGYLVPMDRLVGRYDNVKAPDPPEKGQNTRGGKRGGSARVGDHFLLDLRQWSNFLTNVGDPPRYRPDLQTQKVVLSKKIKF